MSSEQAAVRPPPPEQRGSLSIDPTVLRKVARHAVGQVPGTTTVRRKVAGIGTREQRGDVKVVTSGNDVELSLELALRYPSAVRPVVERVRTLVIEEVQRITAYRVRAVRVTVCALRSETSKRVE